MGERVSHRLALIAVFFIIFSSMFVLYGWISGSEDAIMYVTVGASMKAQTALGFLLCGIGFLLSPRWLCKVMFGAVGVISLSVIFQYVSGVELGIDLTNPDIDEPYTSSPGRMSPFTALCFLMVVVCSFIHNDNLIYYMVYALIYYFSITAMIVFGLRLLADVEDVSFTDMSMKTCVLFILCGYLTDYLKRGRLM
jgi:hypothetical protein